eukprot:TRINITY_DN14605_c0_g1_i1.p1 TRINITY_DN14605_c0_g1~~TRINITY_DN14605_c0_g1_i1.p1  ORF type:complete len:481 (-),score=58.17 TRINITY_DN14605_c0_g1_i1:89-1447(-)
MPLEELKSFIDVKNRSSEGNASLQNGEWQSKQIILVRHGLSIWNELCGQHKHQEWEEIERNRRGFRKSLKNLVTGRGFGDSGQTSGASMAESTVSDGADSRTGFWRGVRGGVRHVKEFITHSDKLHQVDHALSFNGLHQARDLRRKVENLLAQPIEEGPSMAIAQCGHWLVSPYLRALMTAGYCLAPLRRRDVGLKMTVTPLANEIMNSRQSFDCLGKPGNIGSRIASRAVSKLSLMLNEDEVDPSGENALSAEVERVTELGDVSGTMCSMDYSEVGSTWWKNPREFRKADIPLEDDRIRKLVERLLADPESTVGVVGHSQCFRRLIQLFCPTDEIVKDKIRDSLRNGTFDSEGTDPLKDKIMNCGVLVLTMKYGGVAGAPTLVEGAEIVEVAFLFDGHMETAIVLDDDMRSECAPSPEDDDMHSARTMGPEESYVRSGNVSYAEEYYSASD